MSPIPAPRPALRRTDDGSVRAVPAHLSSLAVDPAAVAKAARKKAKKKDTGGEVQLTVPVSKKARKQLRQKAARYGWTAEEAAGHVLRAWAED